MVRSNQHRKVCKVWQRSLPQVVLHKPNKTDREGKASEVESPKKKRKVIVDESEKQQKQAEMAANKATRQAGSREGQEGSSKAREADQKGSKGKIGRPEEGSERREENDQATNDGSAPDGTDKVGKVKEAEGQPC